MQDIELKCRDCGETFTFTAGEQEFYQQKGFTNQPTRCPECRKARKAQRNNFNSDSHWKIASLSGRFFKFTFIPRLR